MSLFYTLKRFKVINNFFCGVKEDSEGAYVLFKDSYTLYQIKEKECRKIKDEYLHLERKYNGLIKVVRELQTNEKYKPQPKLNGIFKDFWVGPCILLSLITIINLGIIIFILTLA